MPRLLALRVRLGAAVVLVCLAARLPAAEERPLAARLPPEVGLYLHYRPGTGAADGTPTALERIYRDPALQAALAPLLKYARFLDTLSQFQAGISVLDLLAQVPGSLEAAALPPDAEGRPRAVLRLPLGGYAETFRTSLPELELYLGGKNDGALARRAVGTAVVKGLTLRGRRLEWALAGGELYLGLGPEALDAVLVPRAAGAPALAQAEAFGRTLALVEPAPGTLLLYGRPEALLPAAPAPGWRRLLAAAAPAAVGLATTPHRRGFRDRLVLHLDEEPSLLRALVGPEPVPPQHWQALPAGVTAALSLHCRPDRAWERAWPLLERLATAGWGAAGQSRFAAWRQRLAAAEETLGFDMTEILASLGPALTLARTRAGWVALVQVRHPEALEAYLEASDRALGSRARRQISYRGEVIHYWNRFPELAPLVPAYCRTEEGMLLVGPTPQAVKALLFERLRPARRSLLEVQRSREVMAPLTEGGAAAYLRLPPRLLRVYDVGLSMAQMSASIALNPLDPGQFPPGEHFAEHLFDLGLTARRVEGGVLVEAYSPCGIAALPLAGTDLLAGRLEGAGVLAVMALVRRHTEDGARRVLDRLQPDLPVTGGGEGAP